MTMALPDPAARRAALKRRIVEGRPLAIPGCGDGFGARLIEHAGFEALYMSGFAVEGSFGFPDVGLLSMAEIANRAADIGAASRLPLICDCDTGYGGLLNVQRTVRSFERAGAAAIQFEDQQLPKKCGSMSGKRIVSTAEMADRLRAAVDSRDDVNLQIIGRSDAAASEGLGPTIARLHAYAEAGADLLMVLGPYSAQDVAFMAKDLPRPLVYLYSESRSMPLLSTAELAAIGVSVVIFPLSLLLTAARAMQNTLEHLREHGSTAALIEDHMASYAQFHNVVDLAAYQVFEASHASDRA